jgi:methyl-accepting chemotaxis protein
VLIESRRVAITGKSGDTSTLAAFKQQASAVDKVEAGARLVGDAGTTMTEIVASVGRVNDVIGEITSSAAEQSQGLGEVNAAVGRLDQMTQQNAALVEQSAAAAESLREQARRLAELVGAFRIHGQATG